MNICCLECNKRNVFRKRFENTFLCSIVKVNFAVWNVKDKIKYVMTVVKKMCNCIDYEVEYDYGIDQILCLDCFEKQDSETQLYRYFRNKYNEPLT